MNRSTQARHYHLRGDNLRGREDNAGAIAEYSAAIALCPDFASALNRRGAARSDTGDLLGGASDLDRAIALDPSLADAYLNRGTVRVAVGDFVGADEEAKRALALRPSADGVAQQGAVRHGRKDYRAAIADYDRALADNPRLFWAYIL